MKKQKQTIRLNESQLRRIVKESVKRVLRENYDYDFANDTLSGQNDFMKDYRASAHKFSHDGADAYFARKEQDKMHKNERRRKSYTNKKINQFANTDMGLNKELRESVKKVLNEEYGVDFEDTLAWVKKKKPDMSPEEQERFAKNIIKKREHDNMIFELELFNGDSIRELSWNEAKRRYINDKKGYIEEILYKDKREGPYGEWHEFNPRYFFEED